MFDPFILYWTTTIFTKLIVKSCKYASPNCVKYDGELLQFHPVTPV